MFENCTSLEFIKTLILPQKLSTSSLFKDANLLSHTRPELFI